MNTIQDFVDSLCTAGPISSQLIVNHIADYQEVLPHVSCGDISRKIVRVFQGKDPKSAPEYPECIRILGVFDAGIQSHDPRVRDLVRASFLENVADRLKHSDAFRRAVSRRLADELSRHFAFDEFHDPGKRE